MTEPLCSYNYSSCGWPHRTCTRSSQAVFYIGQGRGPQVLTYHRRVFGSWWLRERGNQSSSRVWLLVGCSFSQWISLHTSTLGSPNWSQWIKKKRIGSWAEDAVVCGIRGDGGWRDVSSGDDRNSLYMPEITKEQESFDNVKGMSKLCLL